MSEKAETRAEQAAKESRATTSKVSNLEARVAFLEQDAPEPMPVLPKQAERVEQQDVIVPQSWQVRAFDTTDRTNPANPVYKAEFQIYNPVLFFGGEPQEIDFFGGGGWITLNIGTPLSSSHDVVARVTYKVDAEGERSFEKAEIVAKKTDEQKPEAEAGKAIDDIEIATLHSSGWSAITQHQTGPIYLGGGGGGGTANLDSSEYQIHIYVDEKGEAWLTQGVIVSKDSSGAETKAPKRKILRLDNVLFTPYIGEVAEGDSCFCQMAELKWSWGCLKSTQGESLLDTVNIPSYGRDYSCMHYPTLREYTAYTSHLCVSYPQTDTDMGYVGGKDSSIAYFATKAPVSDGEEKIYFYTEIAIINETAVYS